MGSGDETTRTVLAANDSLLGAIRDCYRYFAETLQAHPNPRSILLHLNFSPDDGDGYRRLS